MSAKPDRVLKRTVHSEDKMVERFFDLEEKEYQKIEDQLDSIATNMEVSESNTGGNTEYGICNQCKHFSIAKTEFRIVRALCSKYAESQLFVLKSDEPIIECTDFWDNFKMNLYDMQKIAYIIEIDKSKIGFLEEKT